MPAVPKLSIPLPLSPCGSGEAPALAVATEAEIAHFDVGRSG
jgi:hypothetical protein